MPLRLQLLSFCVVLAGCQSNPYVNAHIDTVNAEYRQLEDYVYALEEENQRLHQELGQLQRRAPAREGAPSSTPARGGLFRDRREGASGGGVPDTRFPSAPPDAATEPPTIEIPDTSPAPPPSSPNDRSRLQRPELDSPPDRSPPADTPPRLIPREIMAPPRNEEPSSEDALPAPDAPSNNSEPEQLRGQPVDRKVTHLFLSPLTGAADFNGQPGDDGLCVILEPRNAGDQYVSEAGAVSVVLLDPARQGEAARIARWDFDKSTTQQLMASEGRKTAGDGGKPFGIKLEMPWPVAPPASNQLKLFVRYETADGRRLQTDRDIFVTSPGQALSRWTPRPAGRKVAEVASASSANPMPSVPTLPAWSPDR